RVCGGGAPGPIRSRLERARLRGFSRFVGRRSELARLDRALLEAESGRPRVVLITGEPGAGKSRLCHEFAERARRPAIHHARALSRGRWLPFHTIAELARGLLGLDEGAGAADVRDAVERGLARAPSLDPAALGLWLDLLGAPDPAVAPSELEPEARRGRLYQPLVDLLPPRAASAVRPIWPPHPHRVAPRS